LALDLGTRLGAYEITAAIGEGGMGQVFRARDTKLDRDVAIKILPEAFAHDADRIARFQREAKTLASLNHPNIAAIHGLEESGGVTALVMELVEGDDLSQRIARGAIPLDEALPIAKQIAEALEAAHKQGIIHRDLKPANVKIHDDGTVKVLDFGLAKAMEPSGSLASDSQSPTITTPAMTQAGVILGTAAYMSPEQARGNAVDKRTDIWAFGCVLYEMLIGARPFVGDTVTETLAAVLMREPDWSRLSSEVPTPIRILLRRCLQKNLRARLADMSAAVVLIEELPALAVTTPASQASVREQVESTVSEIRRGLMQVMRRRVVLVLALGLALAALVGVGVWFARRPPTPAVVRTMVTPSGANSLSVAGFDRDVTITLDGTRIVYRGVNQLLVRALDSLEPTVLPTPSGPQGVFVSPDGEWVGFFDGGSALWKVPIAGGPAVRLTTTGALFPRGATWVEDGTIVYAHGSSAGLFSISASGGNPTRLTSVDSSKGENEHTSPEALPGGRAVLFTVTVGALGGGAGSSAIAALDLRTRTTQIVLRGGRWPRYVASGHLVYSTGANLLAVPFDLDRLAVTGSPVTVLQQVAMTPGSGMDGAVSRSGTLVYVPGAASIADERMLVWVDRQGREEPVPAPLRTYQIARLSPDGTRVALDLRDEDNDIWIWAFASRNMTRLTSVPGNDMFPVWTSDSRRVIFSAAPESRGQRALAWRIADATAAAETLLTAEPSLFYRPFQVSDSTLVLAYGDDLGTLALRADARVPPSSNRAITPLLKTPFVEQNAEVSPSGQWLAYQSNESGRDDVYVRPFPNVDAGRWLVSTNGGRAPLWSRNRKELFYVTLEGAVMSVPVQQGTTWQHGPATQVVRPGYFHAGEVYRTFDVSLDGQRFLMIKQNVNAADVRRSIIVVQNWHEELKRLVPTN
jgi:eukaryotic-like serine/threonine-protein kinase